jgi:signal transduction histidine kinase
MKNLDLLEKHRRKVAFVLAAMTLVLMYGSILIFEFVSSYNSQESFSDRKGFLLFLVLLAPFLYAILSFLACRIMHRVYRPIRESIMNLEQFTTNVNHEFKTSLSEITSSLELWELTQEYSDYNTQALHSAKRLNIILDTLMPMLNYTNSSYMRKNTDIIKIFEWIISENIEEIEINKIHLEKKYPPSMKSYIDIWPLTICFQNVLKNAIKYNKQNGKIRITIWKDFFEIFDTWKGIKKENMDKIFSRYFQERDFSEWFWVWLSLVKQICDRYKWNIKLESKEDEFTKVKISF